MMQTTAMTSPAPILVVDDFPLVAATIKGLLKAEGYRDIEIAHGASEALEKLAQRPYQLVISDMKMPGMTGLDLFHAVRKSSALQDTRFLMVTGQRTVDFNAIQNAGCAVLVKPFSSETLSATIADLCSVAANQVS